MRRLGAGCVLAFLGLPLLASAGVAAAGDGAKEAAAAGKKPHHSIGWYLLPKAFQRNPDLDISAITEFTALGSKVKHPTAAEPAYYVASSGGEHTTGDAYPTGTVPKLPLIEETLHNALASQHYLPASSGHPATYLIVYNWGSLNMVDADIGDPGYSHALVRAAVIGGKKFAKDLQEALKEEVLYSTSVSISGNSWGVQMEGVNSPSPLQTFSWAFDPIERFRRRDLSTERLMAMMTDDCFFIAVSAYGITARGKPPVLLWRTKLTTSSVGVSLGETVLTLFNNGADYFGRQMSEPDLLTRTLHRDGRVEVGTPVVEELGVSTKDVDRPTPKGDQPKNEH